MAHFLKFTDDDGSVYHINLDMIAEVDVDNRKVTLVTDDVYTFDDDMNDSDWRHVMKFINEFSYR